MAIFFADTLGMEYPSSYDTIIIFLDTRRGDAVMDLSFRQHCSFARSGFKLLVSAGSAVLPVYFSFGMEAF